MKKLTLLIVSLLLISTVSNASVVTVNFSTAEGYANGALLNNENWNATVTYPGNWIVDVATESVSADKIFQSARWGRKFNLLSTGDKITFSVEFDCEIEGMPTTNSLMAFGFSPNTDPTSNSTLNQVHLKKAAAVIQLRNSANSANLSPTAELNLTDIDDPASSRTKLLAVEVSLTLGADAASSVISGKVFNLTDNTSSDVGSYTGINATLFNAITTTGIYGTFSTQANNCKPTVYKVSMTDITTSTKFISNDELKVTITDKQLTVTGLALNDEVRVYSSTGSLYMKTNYTGETFDLSYLPNGYYILKSNNVVRKILVK